MDIRKEVISELDNRLAKLKENHFAEKNPDNAFEGLDSAMSRVIGATLTQEIENIKRFVENL